MEKKKKEIKDKNKQQLQIQTQQHIQQKKETKQQQNIKQEQKNKQEQDLQLEKKNKKIVQLEIIQKTVPLFVHLPQYSRRNSQNLKICFNSSINNEYDIHPAIIQLGLKYSQGIIIGSNARCVAMLNAFIQVLEDISGPPNILLFRDFDIKPLVQFLIDCRPKSISMGNAINYLKIIIASTKKCPNLEESKNYVINKIRTFIHERITIADEMISDNGASRICNGDVIMTYARSHVVEMILKKAYDQRKNFRVIIVDSRPRYEGKTLLHRLVQYGIECTYVLINSVSYMMKEVTKVFVGAYTLMANGNLISRVGTAIIAMMAHEYHVSFIVCCETYKFTERVQLESISFNELGDPDELALLDNNNENENKMKDWKNIPNLKLLNLFYDLTPTEFIDMVITEVGMVPVTSVPVILREYRKDHVNI